MRRKCKFRTTEFNQNQLLTHATYKTSDSVLKYNKLHQSAIYTSASGACYMKRSTVLPELTWYRSPAPHTDVLMRATGAQRCSVFTRFRAKDSVCTAYKGGGGVLLYRCQSVHRLFGKWKSPVLCNLSP